MNADQCLDQSVTIDSSGKVERINNITVLQSQNTAGNISSTMQNAKYSGQRTNIYASTSELAKYNGTDMKTGWVHAKPYLACPGHSVIFHYDSAEGEYKTQAGRLTEIMYSSSTLASTTHIPWITFTAALHIFLEPDNAIGDTVQYR